ncbi:MAG: hypothetical protein RLW68_01045 [Devosia marina]|uniref:hypothetical protein n=1 Tax=Devosia marina TaxID=2683198 RepID=UPI0032ED0C22
MTEISELLERVKAARGYSNALDIEIDMALFKPDGRHISVRPNAAKTKLVYIKRTGGTDTFLAHDWTISQASRDEAIRLLTVLQETQK